MTMTMCQCQSQRCEIQLSIDINGGLTESLFPDVEEALKNKRLVKRLVALVPDKSLDPYRPASVDGPLQAVLRGKGTAVHGRGHGA